MSKRIACHGFQRGKRGGGVLSVLVRAVSMTIPGFVEQRFWTLWLRFVA
jgi:hypothetical protein